MASVESTVRVFLCSPYRDMQAERAYLHEMVFPQVNQRYEENGFHLEIVDPRRNAASEEEAEGTDSLEASLDEIERCRPYFMCLLGANYGKVTVEVPDPIGRKHAAIRHYFRMSRVHIETMLAMLRQPHLSTHSYFYFRNPDFLTQVPASDKPTFVPNNQMEAMNEVETHKLEIFKEAITRTGRPVRHYVCNWDESQRQVAGLEELGAKVEHDLLSIVGLATPAPAAEEAIPVAAEEVAGGVPVAAVAAVAAGAAGVSAMAALAATEPMSPLPAGAFDDSGAEAAAEAFLTGDEGEIPVADNAPVEALEGEPMAEEYAGGMDVQPIAAEEAPIEEYAGGEGIDSEPPIDPLAGPMSTVDPLAAEAAAAEAFLSGETADPVAAEGGEVVAEDAAVEMYSDPAEAAAAEVFTDPSSGRPSVFDQDIVVSPEAAAEEGEDPFAASGESMEESIEEVVEEEPKKKGWFGGKKKKK